MTDNRATATIMSELDRLTEENARLRHDIDRAITNHSADLTSEAALITENARLRKALMAALLCATPVAGAVQEDPRHLLNEIAAIARVALPKEPI